MQAIVTKYIGPTNFRGSRVRASCQAGSVTLSWNAALTADDNHDAAAKALRAKLGWDKDCYPRMYRGGLPDMTGNVYVFGREGEAL